MLVVVRDVVDDETFELLVVPDDGAVEELSPDRSDPTLSERVGDRRADRSLEDLEALRSEYLVEVIDELAAAVANQSTSTFEPVGVAEEQVAGCLGGPVAGGVRGETSEDHLAGFDVDEEQDVVAAQECCVDGEEVARDSGLGAQELGPGHLRAFRRRVDVVVAEDLPHGCLRDLVTQPDELAMDSSVALRRVLCGEAHDQPAQFGTGWRSTWTPAR